MSRLTSTWLFWLQYLICLENNIKNIHSEPKFWSFWRQRSAHQQFIKHLYKKHSVRAVANSLFVRNILWNSKSNPTFIARFISRKFKNDILATTCYIELRAICNKSGAIVNHSHSKSWSGNSAKVFVHARSLNTLYFSITKELSNSNVSVQSLNRAI